MENYHYTECGLDNVWVRGLDPVVDDEGEEIVTIPGINLLHRAIAESIVQAEDAMTGPELRFLRTEMGLTQAELAGKIGMHAQEIGRWERGEHPINKQIDTLFRILAIRDLELKCDDDVEKLIDLTTRAFPGPGERLHMIDGTQPGRYEPEVRSAA